ncbi:ABC transporter ATP-binding protein [Nocardioides psychrotolerans]|uniref:Branched-chain amino acid transport system ATP-binding protein n=2 Tax=Nocardioides psychrotolerans TaxID=1005945 RepID=A0A1I3IPY7_9ACTN|nr:ABC transporter ATP-binding protein [Nocardioides psychrotolerans]SFI50055.1 branched-chain amino acid transport system ATP-binding protein [Nocardioides psychrotolerans]
MVTMTEGAVPLLECSSVVRRFVGMVAVDQVSIKVNEGDVLGIIGPNGAGKTTLFNLLTGQLKPNSGEVFFRGERITGRPVHERARLGLGRTFQVVRPLPALSVLENTMMGAFVKHPKRRDAEAKAAEVLEEVGLAHVAKQRAGDLPLPLRKRLEVARALATEPVVLLLDEVMAGLNPTDIGKAVDLFHHLHERGVTLVLIEHNLKVVRTLSRHVVVLDHGAVLAEGTPTEVLQHPDVVRAYLGNRR